MYPCSLPHKRQILCSNDKSSLFGNSFSFCGYNGQKFLRQLKSHFSYLIKTLWEVQFISADGETRHAINNVNLNTNRHVINPPPSGGRALPYLGGGFINFFSHFRIRAAPAAGFLRRWIFLTIFSSSVQYSNNSRYFQKRTIEMMENMYKNLWGVI